MKILMLGWEYPPMVSGGLATATEGIIGGLLDLGHEVTLVLPHFPHSASSSNFRIVSPENPYSLYTSLTQEYSSFDRNPHTWEQKTAMEEEADVVWEHQSFVEEPFLSKQTYLGESENQEVHFSSHYNFKHVEEDLSQSQYENLEIRLSLQRKYILGKDVRLPHPEPLRLPLSHQNNATTFTEDFRYSNDEKTYILGLLSLDILDKDPTYDVVHAHDWMSFRALEMICKKKTIPTVAHIHSTEIDRGGEKNNNKKILEIEKMGVNLADAVVAVSRYTQNILIKQFHVSPHKIKVVYNAGNNQHRSDVMKPENTKQAAEKDSKSVITFVGRVTFQKGPSYFVLAAEKVLQKNKNIIFKVVGVGDLLPSMKQLAWELGIQDFFEFEGFLDSKGVQKILQKTDIFVMPSVSEPFGIVALEAIAQNIPLIISRQSGVSEVLSHALKVDFWDVELISDRILSVLKYPKMRGEMVKNSLRDLSHRSWVHSAQALVSVYSDVH